MGVSRAPGVVFQHTRATLRFGALCAHSRVSFWNCWALPELLGLCFSVSALLRAFPQVLPELPRLRFSIPGLCCTSTSIARASEAAFAYSRGCAAICCAALVGAAFFWGWPAARGTSGNGVACKALRGNGAIALVWRVPCDAIGKPRFLKSCNNC